MPYFGSGGPVPPSIAWAHRSVRCRANGPAIGEGVTRSRDESVVAARLYFWRTQTGAEVDFVLEHGRRVVAFEVKSSDNPGYRDTDGLRRFLEAQPDAVGGVLLHGGNAIRRLDKNIIALPWSLIAE